MSSTSISDKGSLKHFELPVAEANQLDNSVWRKFDWRILPVAAMFYFLSFLDRSNIGNARIAGMQKDLKMSDHDYSVALTVTYVPYIIAELPSNLFLKYVGPDRMLPTMVTLWGLVCTMQGIVHNYHGLLACRFFLGLLEGELSIQPHSTTFILHPVTHPSLIRPQGGLFPGLVLYLSGFYPRQFLQLRISIFFASASLSGAFSGLLAAAIINMNGIRGMPGWSWIFILEGIFTFVFGLSSFFITPRSPTEAKFLTKQEKAYVSQRLRDDGVMAQDAERDRFSWVEVGRAFMLPQVILMAFVGFFAGTMIYAMAYFEPTIVAGLGHYSSVQAQLMSVPPFATAFVLSIISAFLSDRFGARGLTMIFFAFLSLIGFSMFLGSTSKSVKYASIFFSLTGAYGLAPPLSAWNANNTAPHVRRATAVAIGFIMTNAGGILATWLLGSLSPGPSYKTATVTFIVFSVATLIAAGLNLLYLVAQNRRKEELRAVNAREDEKEGLGDKSAWFVYSL